MGVYILEEYKSKVRKVYLSREEEALLEELLKGMSDRKHLLLQNVIYKFALPK